MFDTHLRSRVEPRLQPVGANLRRTGITADHLTAFGVVMAVAAAVAIGFGVLWLGVVFGFLCAVPDVLDGAVAKASGTASKRGSFFDSVADRFSDAVIFAGVAWYLSTTQTGPIVVLPLAVLGMSMLISYERAKAESLGFHARGGVMERAERLFLLAIGVLFESLLIPVLWIMLVLTAFTAVQRFVVVWRQASAEVPVRPSPVRNRLRARRSRRTARRVDRMTWRTYRERWASTRERRLRARNSGHHPSTGA
jgi:CDP-diacylglycerol--glycerol-3-phosphate 3-phosphatidyltransferase